MTIEPISYASFSSLTTAPHSTNDGCAWYSSSNRRVCGQIQLDFETQKFRSTLLQHHRARWKVSELAPKDTLDEAEALLVGEMANLVNPRVTVKDVPMRLRFGRGRPGRPR